MWQIIEYLVRNAQASPIAVMQCCWTWINSDFNSSPNAHRMVDGFAQNTRSIECLSLQTANIQIFHLLKWEKYRISKFMSSYHILEVILCDGRRYTISIYLITYSAIYIHVRNAIRKQFFFPKNIESGRSTTKHTYEIQLDWMMREAATKRNSVRIRLIVSHSRMGCATLLLSQIAPKTRLQTLNVFHSWPSSWNFIWINKSPLQKCIYSFATRSGAISVHETIYILTHCKHTQYTPCSQAVARTS